MKKFVCALSLLAACCSGLRAAEPRPEYPRPQFERQQWINLNGTWSFSFDDEMKGRELGWQTAEQFDRSIIVPFVPESELSGIGRRDFTKAVWYARPIEIPAEWDDKLILLHFGAVDFRCEVFVDGKSVGGHTGGTSSFTIDLTPVVKPGTKHNLVVYVEDDIRSGVQPAGKQSTLPESHGCFYTRSTGIWQTVWMEPVDPHGLRRVEIIPDVDRGAFFFTPEFYGLTEGQKLLVTVKEGRKIVAQSEVNASNSTIVTLPLKKPKLWSPESPFLYGVEFEVLDERGRTVDHVYSYAGMRKFHIEGNKLYLNNKPFFLRMVLDQGFYPDGIWTAPSDEALRRDIELSKAAGFNGARLHQKVFEERFHYWADRLGYVTFGEASDWGCNRVNPAAARVLLTEWTDNVKRDMNHPSIIAWTPMNEAWGVKPVEEYKRLNEELWRLTHLLDRTRPVSTASGGSMYRTDIWTVHNYEQDPAKLAEQMAFDEGNPRYYGHAKLDGVEYGGQPYFVDEFGGIKWNPERQEQDVRTESWGYGDAPRSLEEFYARLRGQVDALVDNPNICGYCYTQLTDVEQEQNGIYFYDRTPKFDMEVIHSIFSKEPMAKKKCRNRK